MIARSSPVEVWSGRRPGRSVGTRARPRQGRASARRAWTSRAGRAYTIGGGVRNGGRREQVEDCHGDGDGTRDDGRTTAAAVDKSGRRVRSMFASIAGRYDLLNHLLSLNIDRLWRRFTTRTVPPSRACPVLDCCTGTADLALAYHRAGGGARRSSAPTSATRCSPSGNAKVRKAGAAGNVVLIEGDTQRLPLPGDTFGVVTVAFGLRNVGRHVRGIDEMIRVARPGGKVAILEFSRPRGRDPRPALPRLLPPGPPPGRPGARAQRARRLRLPAGERAAVPRRPGDARPARLARPDRRCGSTR